MFDNLYMLWMCIWMGRHHLTAAYADQSFRIFVAQYVRKVPSDEFIHNGLTLARGTSFIDATGLDIAYVNVTNCLCIGLILLSFLYRENIQYQGRVRPLATVTGAELHYT